MAYRSSHFRKGYWRKTPNGHICWVSPTTVSGYTYTPGHPTPNYTVPPLQYQDKGINVNNPVNTFEHPDAIKDIIALFESLDSEERKYCLDTLDSIDTDLDNVQRRETLENSPPSDSYQNSFFKLSRNADGAYTIDRFIGISQNTLTIPNSIDGRIISTIGKGAFENCTDIKSIIIPEGITKIDERGFYNCTSLYSIVLPQTLALIGASAFSFCAFKEISIPSSVTSIGKSAFASCKKLEKITLPESLTEISVGLFSGCEKLSSFNIPACCYSIERYAFYRIASSIHAIYLPNSIHRIGKGAFSEIGRFPFSTFSSIFNNTSFQEKKVKIYIPDSVTSIDRDAFESSSIIICCSPGSYALEFARTNHIPYEPA
ncbi:MAG: leucine-rich repeat domain-containing protein [Christensenellales bacterium]|nr:leucine-rich repeat domain-containing protein [Christensenellales bacterium]